ncbi:hypothetical protein BTI59_09305, partial [Lactobacillus delbrueckii subsp. bulgaricus]|nr:hypothetical protein [Lactobacillus delbrueckii subsp. bulgaricus]
MSNERLVLCLVYHHSIDTWFSNPHQIVQISQRGLNVIAMVKKSSKITYEFEEKRMNVKQIFNAC